MADYRNEVQRLQAEYTKDELIDVLAERTGKRTTSVNPLTESMFAEIVPNQQPVEYARKSEDYSEDMSRVATNATGLKILLHEQVGRPLYEPIERLVKKDFAECIAAVDAYNEGYERGRGKHVSTTLPREVDAFVDAPPDRSQTCDSPFDVIVEFDTEGRDQVSNWDVSLLEAESSYFVYVLDCTPSIDSEPPKLWDRRRAVQTKTEAGIQPSVLEPKEQAAHALNRGERVYYVGSTNDVSTRVREHLVGTDKSGVNFTNTFSPRSLVKVQGCDTRASAESLEGTLARELHDREGVFAYSDEM